MNTDHQRDADRGHIKSDRATAQHGVVVAFPDRRATTVEFGSGWYHDAAIKESAQPPARR